MFSAQDIIQIKAIGSTSNKVGKQIEYFEKGFPFMPLVQAANIGNGILELAENELDNYISVYENTIEKIKVVKFVPASGAASRMFKSLFTALDEGEFDKTADQFFEKLEQFAFAEELKSQNSNPRKIDQLKSLLLEPGLAYGILPKGLLSFHKYDDGTVRSPVEEHLVEGANYANSAGKVHLHLTVSPEHKSKFESLLLEKLPQYEAKFKVKFDIEYSVQKSSTDTIAVNIDNTPFREPNGSLLFRPAGHGALLENLNEIDANLIFIKNIDNVVPDRIKDTTIKYKKAIAGLLISLQKQVFDYMEILRNQKPTLAELAEIRQFMQNKLFIKIPENHTELSNQAQIEYYFEKLNRPFRICGMVKNQGEPGGGPFWCNNNDGTSSLQIVESAQVDLENANQNKIFSNSTHFNPVDLVCGTKNYLDQKFDLMNYSDPETGFITKKSKDGKTLKAQELPGLWNGAMADWTTIFVEIPLITFSPVKTINDLLKPEHQ